MTKVMKKKLQEHALWSTLKSLDKYHDMQVALNRGVSLPMVELVRQTIAMPVWVVVGTVVVEGSGVSDDH